MRVPSSGQAAFGVIRDRRQGTTVPASANCVSPKPRRRRPMTSLCACMSGSPVPDISAPATRGKQGKKK
jgi:hypothetical protein